MIRLDLQGEVFGKLTVLEFSHIDSKRQWRWICVCECGNKRTVESYKLRNGYISSCGCFRKKPVIKRGFVDNPGRKNGKETSEYRSWQHMKDRCSNPDCKAYKGYGGRGIKVCDRWLESFENFFADMGKKPSRQHSIDRYPNNDGDYEPSNCRWATRKEQAGNRRSSHWFDVDGEKMILKDLADKLGVTANTIHNRINQGLSPIDSRIGKLVLDTQTGIFYNSAKEAAFIKNINPYYLRNQLSGSCKNISSLIYA